MSGRKRSVPIPEKEDGYQQKRQKNNEAVNRTRAKKRQEESETADRVEELRVENEQLERKVDSLQKELSFLKEMFVAYANGKKDADPSGPSTTLHIYRMAEDASQLASVAEECVKTSTEALENAKKFLAALGSADVKREGISLLEVKNREMLAYMAEVSYLMGRMSCGQSIAGDPAVLRAAKHRTILERVKPMEDKMRSQIEKLTRVEGSQPIENGKTLRARPDQMDLDDSEESEDEENQDDGEKKTKKYIPPKMMAVHYEEDDDPKSNKKLEKAKKRALQSSLIQELKQQYSDAPIEFREVSRRQHEIDKERERFEEDNLVRLRVTRADRAREARATRDNAIDDLLNFGNYMMRGEDGEAIRAKRKTNGGGPPGKKTKTGRFEKRKMNDAKKRNKQKKIKRRQ